MNDQSDSRPQWQAALAHNSVVHLANVNALDGLEAHPEATAVCIEQSTIADLGPLRRLSGLRELHLIGVDTSSLDIVTSLTKLVRLSVVGCPLRDASPLLATPSLRECVLRAVPWSNESWGRDIPLLKSNPALTTDLPATGPWSTCVDAHQLFAACAETIGDGKGIVVFYGARPDGLSGTFSLSRQNIRAAITSHIDPGSFRELVRTNGQPNPGWAYQVAAQRLSKVQAESILLAIEKANLPGDAARALRRYVQLFPDLTFKKAPATPAEAAAGKNASLPGALLALIAIVGAWDLNSPPEVRLNLPGPNAGSWWRWLPTGAWNPWDRTAADDRVMVPIADDFDQERALWVQAGPGDQSVVWLGSVSEHAPGGKLDVSTMTRFAGSLPELLDAITAVRLPGGHILEAKEVD